MANISFKLYKIRQNQTNICLPVQYWLIDEKELKTGSFPTFLKLRDLNEKTKQYHCRQNALLENVIIVREQ